MVEENLKEVPKKSVGVTVKDTSLTPKVEKRGEYNAEIIRDYDGKVDPFYLSDKDPEYSYRFLRNNQNNLSIKTSNILFQKGGWQITPKEHLLRIGLKENELDGNGHLIRGDTILAFMPKKLFKEKNEYKRKLADVPVNAVKRMLKGGDSSVGMGIHHTMKGIQTKEELRGNWK